MLFYFVGRILKERNNGIVAGEKDRDLLHAHSKPLFSECRMFLHVQNPLDVFATAVLLECLERVPSFGYGLEIVVRNEPADLSLVEADLRLVLLTDLVHESSPSKALKQATLLRCLMIRAGRVIVAKANKLLESQ